MRVRSSTARILETLAFDAPITMYSIAKKNEMSKSLVHKIIRDKRRGLEAQKLVKAHSSSKWRTGLTSHSYILTFLGIVEYFDILFKEKRIERQKVKLVVQKYGDLLDFPLFKEHKILSRILGEAAYDFFASAAWLLKNHPPHIAL